MSLKTLNQGAFVVDSSVYVGKTEVEDYSGVGEGLLKEEGLGCITVTL